MLSANEIMHFLKKNKPYFKEHFHCTEIALFGSFARNEQREDSDIDILVVFEPGTANLYDVEQKLKDYLNKRFNRKVDICAKKWINPIFKPMIMKDAVYA